MTKIIQMLSRNLKITAIIAIACVYAHPAFGQRVPGANPAKEERVPGGTSVPEAQSSSEEQELKVFQLTYSNAGEMANVLSQIIPGLNIAIDQRNNAIVVGGAKEKLQTADVLLRRLDTAVSSGKTRTSPVNIRLVWLVEGDESAAPPSTKRQGKQPTVTRWFSSRSMSPPRHSAWMMPWLNISRCISWYLSSSKNSATRD